MSRSGLAQLVGVRYEHVVLRQKADGVHLLRQPRQIIAELLIDHFEGRLQSTQSAFLQERLTPPPQRIKGKGEETRIKGKTSGAF